MIPHSIRWRLPLSYAAIALVTTLVLGAMLLTILRGYYLQQELDYLTGNAQDMSVELAHMVNLGLPSEVLAAQLKSFSFLSQTRIRLLDKTKKMIVDSGNPQDLSQVAALSINIEVPEGEAVLVPHPITTPLTVTGSSQYASFIFIESPEIIIGSKPLTRTMITTSSEPLSEGMSELILESPGIPGRSDEQSNVPSPIPDFISYMSTIRTPYGFDLDTQTAADKWRSDQVITQPFYDAEGKLLGYIELSEGPAYGREIVRSVAWGWGLASAVAVLLAAGVGWLISQRITRPLVALADVTSEMAGGNLSVRANVIRQDEVGQLAHSFNHMANQVEETVIALRRFVSDAAHELHTPLTALRTNLELSSGKMGEAERYSFITRALTQVARLESLTHNLLDLSCLETGAGAGTRKSVNFNTLIQETSEIYASQAEQNNLSFILEMPQVEVTVWGNETQLRRVVSNLLDNALKFTPAGGTVALRLCQDEAGVELTVQDTGIGIPPADLPQLFSRFHRGRNATTYPGSGLGLAMVKAIVEGHGGQVSVENIDPGACFRLHL